MKLVNANGMSILCNLKIPKIEEYLPAVGEGDTLASQLATAVCKISYRFLNDGDKCNDVYVRSYTSWLEKNSDKFPAVKVTEGHPDSNYMFSMKNALWGLKDNLKGGSYAAAVTNLLTYSEEIISSLGNEPKSGSVYND